MFLVPFQGLNSPNHELTTIKLCFRAWNRAIWR